MENELNIEGLGIAQAVIETIVSLAAAEVEGVAGIGTTNTITGLKVLLAGSKPSSSGVAVAMDDGAMTITVRMQVFYGFRLPEVAAAVRSAVSDAIEGQTGIKVSSVDIFVDGIVFAE